MAKKSIKRGGFRAGSGRKSIYGEPTSVITFRCPESHIQELKNMIEEKLCEWKIKQHNNG